MDAATVDGLTLHQLMDLRKIVDARIYALRTRGASARRLAEYYDLMERLTGLDPSDPSRSWPYPALRGIIFDALLRDGWALSEIGRATGYNPASVSYVAGRVDDFRTCPAAYDYENKIYKYFNHERANIK